MRRSEIGWRRTSLLDTTLGLALTALVLQIESGQPPARRIGFACAAVALVALRRRYPVPVLFVNTVLVMVTLVLRTPSNAMLLVLGVTIYAVATHADRRPWLHVAAALTVLVGAGLLFDFHYWWRIDSLRLLAWVFGSAALGDAVHSRRAYLAEATERIRQAELSREEEARRRVIDERVRIARELHDVVAHHIAVISVQAGAATHVLRQNAENVWPVLVHIREAADTVLTEIQSVVGVLRDPNEVASTEPTPGLDRLADLLHGLRAMGFRVDVDERGTPRPLPAMTDMAAYRIIQEALTNAHRYGDGGARLELTYTPDLVALEVTNRLGHPVRHPVRGSGYGLVGMRERAAAAQGTLVTGPTDDGSFRVLAVLPADEQSHPITADVPVADLEGRS
ncbi:sensor histidine kinase [Cryptosporangium sp. NPDC051539]|uniref:sensor histidine kinase n=1 Tax=Cryptosporangium sp. NPDC051539 TaxID=3363962 RepID=UPI0037B0538E